jgi:hypothetical protein
MKRSECRYIYLHSGLKQGLPANSGKVHAPANPDSDAESALQARRKNEHKDPAVSLILGYHRGSASVALAMCSCSWD